MTVNTMTVNTTNLIPSKTTTKDENSENKTYTCY